MFPASPTRRTLLRGALGLGTALTACGDVSTTARTSGDVTLSLWTHDPGYEDFFRKGIPEADRLTDFRYHLDVTRAGPADLVTKLLAQAVAGGGTPDAIGFEIGSFPRMLRGDIAPRLLHDLTPDIATVPGLKDDLLPARLAPYSKDGRLSPSTRTPRWSSISTATTCSRSGTSPRTPPLGRSTPNSAPACTRTTAPPSVSSPRSAATRARSSSPSRYCQYIVQSVPDSVLEAARIDGAGEFGIFRTIVLPLPRPSLGALAVWQFLQSYNVPAVALFVVLRKQLLEGLSTGAVKG
ncbi:ABC transporter permease subunit [Streptomyces sp. NPDC088921]|uniref:ABC transporter permease subunit n=1 Tax=unclassified Streptomyces TaxID=2593676 RepID=UPI003426E48B